MGKDLRGKELGEGIYQQANGTYCARFVDRLMCKRNFWNRQKDKATKINTDLYCKPDIKNSKINGISS